VQDTLWWHVYPLGFLGAEPAAAGAPVTHRLRKLVDWLGYAAELGASGLLLGPIFASATHGYDTIDYFTIDRRLGDAGDFTALLDGVRERGMRVLLDGVFNHVSREFPVFGRMLEHGARSPESAWFRVASADIVRPGAEPDVATFEGHHKLVALNHAAPAVLDHVVSVMDHWLSAGADGWRLDAAYAVPREFWSQAVSRVRAHHPDAYFVGEVIHGDYAAIVRDGELDSVTQYELWKAIWSSLNDRNFFELAWALDRHNEMLDTFVPLTFLGNHDTTRIASRLADSRHLAHALAVLLTVAGSPSIYYGDEQALHGLKENRAGGDDAVRPAYPREGPSGLSSRGWPTYRLHQQLIDLRRQHPWIHRARTRPLHLTNRQLIYETRLGVHHLTVALNLDEAPYDGAIGSGQSLLAGDGSIHGSRRSRSRLALPPHGWAVLGPRDADRAPAGDATP